jgi:hypothetical protein
MEGASEGCDSQKLIGILVEKLLRNVIRENYTYMSCSLAQEFATFIRAVTVIGPLKTINNRGIAWTFEPFPPIYS